MAKKWIINFEENHNYMIHHTYCFAEEENARKKFKEIILDILSDYAETDEELQACKNNDLEKLLSLFKNDDTFESEKDYFTFDGNELSLEEVEEQ